MKKIVTIGIASLLFYSGYAQDEKISSATAAPVRTAVVPASKEMTSIEERLKSVGATPEQIEQVMAEENKWTQTLSKVESEKLSEDKKAEFMAPYNAEKEKKLMSILGEQVYRKFLESGEKKTKTEGKKNVSKTEKTKIKTKTSAPVMQRKMKTEAKKN